MSQDQVSVSDVLLNSSFHNLALKIPKTPSEEPPITAGNDEKALFELECGWIFFEQRHYELALDHAKKAAAFKKLDLATKLKIKDLHAHCLRKLHSDREVYLFLQKSVKYLNRFPSEAFAFSIYINYLQALVSLGFEKEAKDFFEIRPKFLRKIKGDVDWLKSYVLTRKLEYMFSKENDEKINAFRMVESLREIAEFLGEEDLMNYCSSEEDTYTFEEDPSQVYYFGDWTYLKFEEMVLFTKKRAIKRLEKNENIKRIIDLLLPGPMQVDEFFKRVTNKTYDQELHAKFLDQILSKVGKVLTKENIGFEENKVFLK